MKTTWITSQNILPFESVSLGQLVVQPSNPTADFHVPRLPRDYANIDHVSASVESLHSTLGRTTGSAFNIFLTKLCSTTLRREVSRDTTITADACKAYKLLNSGDFFRNVCRSTAARDWLEDIAISRGKGVYLVTEIMTIVDAQVSTGMTDESDTTKGITLPLFGTGLVVLPGTGTGELGIGIKRRNTKMTTDKCVLKGEKIFAMQFRKVEISWWSKVRDRGLDRADLEDGNRWEVYLGHRGGDDEKEVIVCARLEDIPEPLDLESAPDSVFGFSQE